MSKPYHRPAYDGNVSSPLFSRSIERLMSAFGLHRHAEIEAQQSAKPESPSVIEPPSVLDSRLGFQEANGVEVPVFGADCPEGSQLVVVDPRTELVIAGPFDEVQAAMKRGREVSPRAVFEIRVCPPHVR